MKPKRNLSILLSGAVIVGVAIGAFTSGDTRYPLSIPVEDLDVGTVWIHDDFHHKVTLVNQTKATVHVPKVSVSCQCTDLQPKVFAIGPQDQLDVSLRIDLSSADRDVARTSEGPFDIQFSPMVKGQGTRTWNVTGIIRNPFDIQRQHIEFPEGSLVQRGSELIVLDEAASHLTVKCLEPIRNFTARMEPQVSELVITPGETANSFDILIDPLDNLDVGIHLGKLRVQASTNDGQESALAIPVFLHILNDIQFSPRNLCFSQSTGRLVKEVTLRSISGERCVVKAFDYDERKFEVIRQTKGESFLVELLDTDIEGLQEETIDVEVSYPNESITEMHSYRVIYRGSVLD